MKLTPKLRKKLETNTTTHGLIDDPKVKAAFEALPPEALEFFENNGKWYGAICRRRRKAATYHLRPDWNPPLEKMQPPWDILRDEIICVARDNDDSPYGYSARPRLEGNNIGIWTYDVGGMWDLSALKFPLGEEHWRDSVVWRPGHEPEGK
jgi:hypothetical protein